MHLRPERQVGLKQGQLSYFWAREERTLRGTWEVTLEHL